MIQLKASMLGMYKMGNFRKMASILMSFAIMKVNIPMGSEKVMENFQIKIKSILETFIIIYIKARVNLLSVKIFMLVNSKKDRSTDTDQFKVVSISRGYGNIINQSNKLKKPIFRKIKKKN